MDIVTPQGAPTPPPVYNTTTVPDASANPYSAIIGTQAPAVSAATSTAQNAITQANGAITAAGGTPSTGATTTSAGATASTLANQAPSTSGISSYPALQNSYGLGNTSSFDGTSSSASGTDYASQPINITTPDTTSRGFNPWSMTGEANARGK